MSERISPTAHYTGYVWVRNGLSHRSLATRRGQALHQGLRPLNALARATGTPSLEGLLLARHRWIDARLSAAIDCGAIGQVIEIAAGLSPRGWDFARRYGEHLDYVEADLPRMAQHKHERLAAAGLRSARHRVVALDALADEGELSLARLIATLDPSRGLAIVTEGLLNYFDEPAVRDMWRRFAVALARFPKGLYLSDLHLAGDNRGVAVRGFVHLLSTFVRGRVHLHFDSAALAADALRDAGFASADLVHPEPQPDIDGHVDAHAPRIVRVLEARTTQS